MVSNNTLRRVSHAPLAASRGVSQRPAFEDGRPLTLACSPQNKDSHYTFIHHRAPELADQREAFCQDRLPDDAVYVPPHLEPLNPEHEDEVIPNQHAAFGIQRATQKVREPAWRDLGLAELMRKGPPPTAGGKGPSSSAALRGGYKGLPR